MSGYVEAPLQGGLGRQMRAANALSLDSYPHRGECPLCDHGTLMHGVGGCWVCECKYCWRKANLFHPADLRAIKDFGAWTRQQREETR